MKSTPLLTFKNESSIQKRKTSLNAAYESIGPVLFGLFLVFLEFGRQVFRCKTFGAFKSCQ